MRKFHSFFARIAREKVRAWCIPFKISILVVDWFILSRGITKGQLIDCVGTFSSCQS